MIARLSGKLKLRDPGRLTSSELHHPHLCSELSASHATRSDARHFIRTGDVRIAVEIEVAAILDRSKDEDGKIGGSRREQEWQGTRSRAKRARPVDAVIA